MSRVEDYRLTLRQQDDWLAFLRAHSALPGPRANLELAQAVATEAEESQVEQLLAFAAALPNTPDEFLLFCGLLAVGPRLAAGQVRCLATLRSFAADQRWRIREAVAMALQWWGRGDMAALLAEMAQWRLGNRYEQRAVVAALCEPGLLTRPEDAATALAMLDAITATLVGAADQRTEPFRVLRQALGYGWSVAAVARPDIAQPLMERWLAQPDPNVRRIMAENLKKNRLRQLDPGWVAAMSTRLKPTRPAGE
jgi:hypothetical protein